MLNNGTLFGRLVESKIAATKKSKTKTKENIETSNFYLKFLIKLILACHGTGLSPPYENYESLRGLSPLHQKYVGKAVQVFTVC